MLLAANAHVAATIDAPERVQGFFGSRVVFIRVAGAYFPTIVEHLQVQAATGLDSEPPSSVTTRSLGSYTGVGGVTLRVTGRIRFDRHVVCEGWVIPSAVVAEFEDGSRGVAELAATPAYGVLHVDDLDVAPSEWGKNGVRVDEVTGRVSYLGTDGDSPDVLVARMLGSEPQLQADPGDGELCGNAKWVAAGATVVVVCLGCLMLFWRRSRRSGGTVS